MNEMNRKVGLHERMNRWKARQGRCCESGFPMVASDARMARKGGHDPDFDSRGHTFLMKEDDFHKAQAMAQGTQGIQQVDRYDKDDSDLFQSKGGFQVQQLRNHSRSRIHTVVFLIWNLVNDRYWVDRVVLRDRQSRRMRLVNELEPVELERRAEVELQSTWFWFHRCSHLDVAPNRAIRRA